jgi:DNA-binding transcriptional regulator LsrR (DeoR family)
MTDGTRAGQEAMATPEPTTEDDGIRQLSAAQSLAVAALHQGATQTDAAEVAGVCRQTVNGWLKQPHVREEIQRLRDEHLAAAARRTQMATAESIDVIRQHLARGDLSAAAVWLKLFGLHRLEVPPSPDTTDRGPALAERLRKLIDKEKS